MFMFVRVRLRICVWFPPNCLVAWEMVGAKEQSWKRALPASRCRMLSTGDLLAGNLMTTSVETSKCECSMFIHKAASCVESRAVTIPA